MILEYVSVEPPCPVLRKTSCETPFNGILSWEVDILANIKSAKKRIKVIEAKTLRNKMIKSKLKTLSKKVNAAVVAGDKALAATCLKEAVVAIDKAAAKGILHKNTAARRVSKLTKSVNAIA